MLKEKRAPTICHFGLNRKRISEWNEKYDSLLQLTFGKAKPRRKLSNSEQKLTIEVDGALFEFLKPERSAHRAVCNGLLSEEAVKVAHSFQLGNFIALSQYIT
ncbi:hypothetical protein HPB48_012280 [Haemaphysalis longicornis]|uniref:Uncharacterized protein n=1 Tax=Haemaphysalis longicornis TaxID=44386 RepID=A0A9J6GKI8_HAELO|nr:hypothetical protein HPB48_012280 [Haemaphysalis longicornis]